MDAKAKRQFCSADQMVSLESENSERLEALKQNPLPEILKLQDEAVAKIAELTYVRDTLLYRIAIVVLSLLKPIAAVGSLVLELGDMSFPEALVALGSAAYRSLRCCSTTQRTTSAM